MESPGFYATSLEAAVECLAIAARNLAWAANQGTAADREKIGEELRSLQRTERVLVDLAQRNRISVSEFRFSRSSLTVGGEPGQFPSLP